MMIHINEKSTPAFHLSLALLIVALVTSSAWAQQEIRADEIFADIGQKSPVGLLYRAHRLEKAGQPAETLFIYEQLAGQPDLNERWRNTVAIEIARWQLTHPKSANVAASRKALDALPEKLDCPDLVRRRDLWEFVVALHGQVIAVAGGGQRVADQQFVNPIGQWRIPSRLRWSLSLAFDRLGSRFESNATTGADFFRHLARSIHHPTIGRLALREMNDLCIEAGDMVGAQQAARGQWLLAVNASASLPEAIERVARTMKANGATQQAISDFKKRQREGDDVARQQGDPLCPGALADADQHQPLFPADGQTAENAPETQPLNAVRHELLNGDLDAAVTGLVQLLAQGVDPMRGEFANAVRMAIALRDGHVRHVADFEQLLRRGGDPVAFLQQLKSSS